MTESDQRKDSDPLPSSDFASEAGRQQVGTLHEFWDLMSHHKKWWIAPTVVVLLVRWCFGPELT